MTLSAPTNPRFAFFSALLGRCQLGHGTPGARHPRTRGHTMRPDELERRLRERLDALGPAPRAELLHVLMLPDLDRADRIGEFYGNPKTRTFAELLIDAEEDPYLRAVLVGMLREADR